MEALNNFSNLAKQGKIYVDKQDTYNYLLKHKGVNGFQDAMQKLDTFTKQGGVNIEIDKLASGGGVISKINAKGGKEILGAHARDIVKSMQSALKKLEECAGSMVKSTKSL